MPVQPESTINIQFPWAVNMILIDPKVTLLWLHFHVFITGNSKLLLVYVLVCPCVCLCVLPCINLEATTTGLGFTFDDMFPPTQSLVISSFVLKCLARTKLDEFCVFFAWMFAGG